MTEAAPPRDAIPGYDRPVVEAWLAANCPELSGPFDWVRLPGGHSNLTWRLTDSRGRQAVIRRPPLGELLPKAHDMGREFRVLAARKDPPVPTPRPLAYCEDPSVTGAHFYVMGHIDGHPLYNADDARRWAPPPLRMTLSHSFIDVLADLHAVDPDEAGLSDLGKKDDYIGRQLKTWYRSWQASVEPAKLDDPRAHTLQKYVLENTPDQGPARLVHGDYGFHNCLVGNDCTIAAVVDWEISTLGDPLADVACARAHCASVGARKKAVARGRCSPRPRSRQTGPGTLPPEAIRRCAAPRLSPQRPPPTTMSSSPSSPTPTTPPRRSRCRRGRCW
jgi:aminoglycoside phosphotransferase (APT) family kinase protein